MDTPSTDINPQGNPTPPQAGAPAQASQPSVAPQEPKLPGPVELSKSALALSKKHFWPLVLIVALPVLFSGLTGAVASSGIVSFSPFFIILGVLLTLPIMILVSWVYLAFYYLLAHSEEGITIEQSFRATWPKILSWWWVCLLAGLIVLGGFFLLVVPGIIFAIWFSLYIYVFILEDQKGLNVLLRSKEYVQGRWWAVLGRGLFLILPLFGITIAFGILTAMLGVFLPQEIIAIILSVLWVGIYIPIYFYHYLIYKACRDTRPQLIGQPPAGKKGWFVASAIWGVVGMIVMIFLVLVVISLSAVVNRESDSGKNPISDFIRGKVLQGLSPIGSVSSTPSSTDTINRIGASSTVNTSEWKTYRNEKYGYTLQYPSWLTPFYNFDSDLQDPFAVGFDTSDAKKKQYFFTIYSFFVEPTSTPLSESIAWGCENIHEVGSTCPTGKNIIIDGVLGVEVKICGGGGCTFGIYVEKNNILYEIALSPSNAKNSEERDIMETILSTFKFTPTP